MFTTQDQIQWMREARIRALAMVVVMATCFAMSLSVDPVFGFVGVMIALIAGVLRYVALEDALDRALGRDR